MSLEKRASIAVMALLKKDSGTFGEIVNSVPRLLYRQRDRKFINRVDSLSEIIAVWNCEHWQTFSLYLLNQKVALQAHEAGNIDEQKEFELMSIKARARLLALEASLKTLCLQNNIDVNELLIMNGIILVFGERAELKYLTDNELPDYYKYMTELESLIK